MLYQRLRGTHDIFGEEAKRFQALESVAHEVFGDFGFEEIRTPILEEKEVFTRALGTETDVVQKEMYEFEDRSKTRVAMRPEGTAGVVRAYLENNFNKTEGLSKFYYLGAMFRSERPQAGRLRQFHQMGVETLGSDSPYADAETIQCLTVFLDRVGAGGYQVKLNNLGTFEERASFKEKLKEYFLPKKNELCEDCKNRLEKNVFRLLDCKVEKCHALVLKSPTIESFLTPESREHFHKVCEALKFSGIAYTQDFYMVRGLDYYTKTVFEITHPRLGAQDALAAGGRYDRLIENFGGTAAGAVGFAVGVERLLMCLNEMPIDAKAHKDKVFIATLGDAAFQIGLKLLLELRTHGVCAAMDFQAKSLKSQMRAADKHKSDYVLILGDNEIQKNIFMLKSMKDGVQEEHALTDVVKILKMKGQSHA